MKRPVSILLSLCLGLFLADAVLSLLDDSLIFFLQTHAFSVIRAIVFFLSLASAVLVYLLIGMTPMIPKRFFLPIVLFHPVALLAAIPFAIYQLQRLEAIALLFSLAQVLLGLAVLRSLLGRWRWRWPLVSEAQLEGRGFSGLRLAGFALVNAVVLLPAGVVYLGFCAVLAVDHYSGSFVALRSDGMAVRARKYVRDDGRTIHLIPMMHIAEPSFYRQVSQLFSTNSVVLLEGVTDDQNLLQHKLSYKRAASSLGLAEQQEIFGPGVGRARHADVDVAQFSSGTIAFLNLVSFIYSEGLTVEVAGEWLKQSQSPQLAERLWTDLLHLRNDHLLGHIRAELEHSDQVVVPWGAAHMPGLARELTSSGFRVSESTEFTVIRFRTVWNNLRTNNQSQEGAAARPGMSWTQISADLAGQLCGRCP